MVRASAKSQIQIDDNPVQSAAKMGWNVVGRGNGSVASKRHLSPLVKLELDAGLACSKQSPQLAPRLG